MLTHSLSGATTCPWLSLHSTMQCTSRQGTHTPFYVNGLRHPRVPATLGGGGTQDFSNSESVSDTLTDTDLVPDSDLGANTDHAHLAPERQVFDQSQRAVKLAKACDLRTPSSDSIRPRSDRRQTRKTKGASRQERKTQAYSLQSG